MRGAGTEGAWGAGVKGERGRAGEGLYTRKAEDRLADAQPGDARGCVVTGGISSIYKRHGKTRKVHNVIVLPSLEAADELSAPQAASDRPSASAVTPASSCFRCMVFFSSPALPVTGRHNRARTGPFRREGSAVHACRLLLCVYYTIMVAEFPLPVQH